MKQTEKLTDQEVHYIIGAFEVASGEHDGDYSDLIAKLYRMNPQVKIDDEDYAKRVQRASDEQDSRRSTITQVVFSDLDLTKPVLEQVKDWVKIDSNWEMLRDAYSDEICLAGDLWKYHLDDLKKAGLLQELRDDLKIQGEKKGNEWMRDHWETKTDKDLWHELIRHLERARR